MQENKFTVPSRKQITKARGRLSSWIRETPTLQLSSQFWSRQLGADTEVHLKLELFQHGGSFKARGALINIMNLSEAEKERGVTAVSAGNHAIAVGYAAQVLSTSAKVVMPQNASPTRINLCKSFGAEVILAADVHQAFKEVEKIQNQEGRFFVHPFEGTNTVLGTATLGSELADQVEPEVVLVPIGGGGLCAGVSLAIKQKYPGCLVFGVEPEGADTMTRSFKSGKPESLDKVRTIADSLGAPYAAPFTFSICRAHVDEIVTVSDKEICRAMAVLFHQAKLAVEPAGAAATAAALGPLKKEIKAKRVALIVCGSNIDSESFIRYLSIGEDELEDK